MKPVRVAALQFDPQIGEVERNLEVLRRAVAAAASLGATLAVAPEAAITGYCFDSSDEAMAVARRATEVAVDRVSDLARTSVSTLSRGPSKPMEPLCSTPRSLPRPMGGIGHTERRTFRT